MASDAVTELLRALRDSPEDREEIRRAVLSDELLEVPAVVARLAERTDALAERMDALVQAQQGTELRLQRLIEQVAKVSDRADAAWGYVLELRYRERAASSFQPIARRLRVLSRNAVEELLDAAVEGGTLDEREAQQVRLADALVAGRLRENDDPVVLVVEVSSVVDRNDVQRAAARAALASRLGSPGIPVVAGEAILFEAAEDARERGVWQVWDGSVEAPPAAA